MRKTILLLTLIVSIIIISGCNTGAPESCDGTWSGTGTDADHNLEYSVEIIVVDGAIQSFEGITDSFTVSKSGTDSTPVCDVQSLFEIVPGYSNDNNLYDASLYETNEIGQLEGVSAHFYEYADSEIRFAGYFHPDLDKAEGNFLRFDGSNRPICDFVVERN